MSGGLSALVAAPGNTLEKVYLGPDRFSSFANQLPVIPITDYLNLLDLASLVLVNRSFRQVLMGDPKKIHRYFGAKIVEHIKNRRDFLTDRLRIAQERQGLLFEKDAAIKELQCTQDCLQGVKGTCSGKVVKYLIGCTNSIVRAIIKLFRKIFSCIDQAFQLQIDHIQKIAKKQLSIENLEKQLTANALALPQQEQKLEDEVAELQAWLPVISLIGGRGYNRLERYFSYGNASPLLSIINPNFMKNACLRRLEILNQSGWTISLCVLVNGVGDNSKPACQQVFKMKKTRDNGKLKCSKWVTSGSLHEDLSILNCKRGVEEVSGPQNTLRSFFNRTIAYLEKWKKDHSNPLPDTLPEALTVQPCKLLDALGGVDAFLSLPYLDIRDSMIPQKWRWEQSVTLQVNLLDKTQNGANITPNEIGEPLIKTTNEDDKKLDESLVIQGDYQLFRGHLQKSDGTIKLMDHCLFIVNKRKIVLVVMLNDLPTKTFKQEQFLSGDEKYHSLQIYIGYPQGADEHNEFLRFIEKLNQRKPTLENPDLIPHDLIKEFGYQ